MGKWVISKPYPKYLANIQTLPNYLLPIKNWVLSRIIGSGRVGYPLPNGYGHPHQRVAQTNISLHGTEKGKGVQEVTSIMAMHPEWLHPTRPYGLQM